MIYVKSQGESNNQDEYTQTAFGLGKKKDEPRPPQGKAQAAPEAKQQDKPRKPKSAAPKKAPKAGPKAPPKDKAPSVKPKPVSSHAALLAKGQAFKDFDLAPELLKGPGRGGLPALHPHPGQVHTPGA